MSKLKGVLHKSDLEGGVWVFDSDQGERYHLEGLPAQFQKDGQKLELEGKVESGMMGIGMMGATFVVSRAQAL